MNIPLVNLKRQDADIFEEMMDAMRSVCEKKNFILGEEVRLFEEEFARYCDACFGIGVASGTESLHLALLACGVGPGDEVIVPTFTFIATALAVSFTGARPVFVDVDPQDYLMTPQSIEKAVTKKTKAVIPVHLYGLPAAMGEICEVAKKHKLFVIEDACQAHGALLNGKKVGSFGDLACFSFYPGKNLGCYGDGGMVVTNNEDLAGRVRMLRDYGRVGKYEHKTIGYNSRLDTVQAALLRVKLKRLPLWNKLRRKNALEYRKKLAGLPVILPSEHAYEMSVFHVFVVRLPKRDEVFQILGEKGVGAIIHYPIPIHLQEAYKELGYCLGDLPVAEKFSKEVVSLPFDPYLSSDEMDYIAENLKTAFQKVGPVSSPSLTH